MLQNSTLWLLFVLYQTWLQYPTLTLLHFSKFFSLGPFGITWLRSQVVDFSIPITIDDATGFLFFEVKKDNGILYRAFGWRVWLTVLIIMPLYIAILILCDRLYTGGGSDWWSYLEFCLRSICLDSVKIPQKHNYNKVFSSAWIWMSFFLFLAYEGKSFPQDAKILKPNDFSHRYISFIDRQAKATKNAVQRSWVGSAGWNALADRSRFCFYQFWCWCWGGNNHEVRTYFQKFYDWIHEIPTNFQLAHSGYSMKGLFIYKGLAMVEITLRDWRVENILRFVRSLPFKRSYMMITALRESVIFISHPPAWYLSHGPWYSR